MTTDDDLIVQTEEEKKQSIEFFNSFRDESWKRQLSNTESFDKTVLTLSSAGLALSLTFLKLIVPVDKADYLWLLKTSWICFLLAIIFSLGAFIISNKAINRQLQIAEDYYVNRKASAFNQQNWFSIINNWLNNFVGLNFVFAITTVVIFVILNLKQGDPSMGDENSKITTSTLVPGLESAETPKMQRTPGHSAQPPIMQAVPYSSSKQSQPTRKSSEKTKD